LPEIRVALAKTALKAWFTGVKAQVRTSPENGAATLSPEDSGVRGSGGQCKN
jgi:hypothetical protein